LIRSISYNLCLSPLGIRSGQPSF